MKNREIKMTFTPKGNIALELTQVGDQQLILAILSLVGALANMSFGNDNREQVILSKKEVKIMFDGLSDLYMKTINQSDMHCTTDYESFEEKYDELIARENKSKPSNVINSKFKI